LYRRLALLVALYAQHHSNCDAASRWRAGELAAQLAGAEWEIVAAGERAVVQKELKASSKRFHEKIRLMK
jgi:hypothetical protein